MRRIPKQITRLARRIGIGAVFTARAKEGTYGATYYGVREWGTQDREWHLSERTERQMGRLWLRGKPFIVVDRSCETDTQLLLHEIGHHIVVLAGESGRESSPELRAAAQEHLGVIPNTGGYFAACFDETGAEAIAHYLCSVPLPSILRRLAERLLRKAGLADLTGNDKPVTALTLARGPLLVTTPVAL